jgi:phenylalanyl-tRNA synthetase alpha chain
VENQDLQKIVADAGTSLADVSNKPQWEQTKATFLGPNGSLTQFAKSIGTVPKEERPAFGKALNQAKGQVESLFQQRLAEIEEMEDLKSLGQKIDPTLPSCFPATGRYSPADQDPEKNYLHFPKNRIHRGRSNRSRNRMVLL